MMSIHNPLIHSGLKRASRIIRAAAAHIPLGRASPGHEQYAGGRRHLQYWCRRRLRHLHRPLLAGLAPNASRSLATSTGAIHATTASLRER